MSKVYILLDSEGKVINCDGGDFEAGIPEKSKWLLIDEGDGEKFSNPKAFYFVPSVRTYDGICQWKYVNGHVVQRSQAEIEAERYLTPRPVHQSTIAELEEALCEIEEEISNLMGVLSNE